ncbi:MAG: hypothetical protein HC817_08490 [Saprospiraceae bacterium]|nr:hypothetical protein [Saprospiraceae bacterium]
MRDSLRITIINDELITILTWKQAMQLVHDIDVKDVLNVALTIELEGKLWTNDKKLKDGLKSKGFNDFFEP